MAPHPTIGGLLRSLRTRKGWTLKQMSEQSGIPLSTLSKVEHDRLTLTYDKLLQLSQAGANVEITGVHGQHFKIVLAGVSATELGVENFKFATP